MIQWLFANWEVAITAFLAVWGGISLAFRVIAPLTPWKWDDKASGWLTRIESWLTAVFVPGKLRSSLGGGKGGGDKA